MHGNRTDKRRIDKPLKTVTVNAYLLQKRFEQLKKMFEQILSNQKQLLFFFFFFLLGIYFLQFSESRALEMQVKQPTTM